ncbi:THAP domain-containing protein 1 B-like [Haemaphysalis longicornis]
MVRYCSVPQCSTYCTEPGISFHYYPENAVNRKKWLARLRNDKEPSKYAMVCSKHFADDAFVAVRRNGKVCKRRKLKTNAEPTLNLPQRSFDRPKLPRKAPVYRAPVLNQLTKLVDSPSSSAGELHEMNKLF